ncbi:MAG: RNA polymerase sporulation sigma factor SigK [Clostridia bacterium]|nr:RNA polymerase sporulation sigma factor SigK [Clostridia bacterium]
MLAFLKLVLSNLFFLTLHLKGGSSFPKPLSAERERALLQRMATDGDAGARAELIEHNLRLVAHIVKKYYAAADDPEDLISIGTIGLIKAVDSFNASKGARLATYAARCIENEILMHFRAQRKTAGTVSLSEPVDTDGDGNELTLIDLIATEDTIADDMDLKRNTRRLYTALDRLRDPREKEILTLRYGLYGTAPLTQREIADRLGISRSYVSRIEKRAIETLRTDFGV